MSRKRFRRLAYTYEIVELVAGQRLVMRTAQGPLPVETTYTWEPVDGGCTRTRLRHRGELPGVGKIATPVIAALRHRVE